MRRPMVVTTKDTKITKVMQVQRSCFVIFVSFVVSYHGFFELMRRSIDQQTNKP